MRVNLKRLKKLKKQKIVLLIVILLVLVGAVALAANRPKPQESKEATLAQSLTQKLLVPCKNQQCINSGLQKITAQQGTHTALGVLQYYVDNVHGLPGDNHLRAHYIGYQTLKSYGMTGQTFLQCTTVYDYGCMHGFIEQMTWDGVTPLAAAKMLCEPIESSQKYSSNMKYYCYHGIGHGILGYLDYDLNAAIKMCDNLDSQLAQTGCWQGVFMENVSAYTTNEESNGTFSKADPLSPCDKVDAKYQRECYINQEGALFKTFDWNFSKAAYACLGAGEQVGTCMEGVGLAAASEPWQKILMHQVGSSSVPYNAWKLCQQFPSGYVTTCVTGAVTQLLQMDGFNFREPELLCSVVDSASADACYRRVGEYTRLQLSDPNKASVYCEGLSSKGQAACRQGAAA